MLLCNAREIQPATQVPDAYKLAYGLQISILYSKIRLHSPFTHHVLSPVAI
jgi:hypothetical protein